MQLCQIHFYQKLARKKVARVNAALRSVASLGGREETAQNRNLLFFVAQKTNM